MKIFGEKRLREYLDRRLEQLAERIRSENENYLLNVNETQIIEYLLSEHRVEPVVFHWDNVSVEGHERAVDGGDGRRHQPRYVVVYHLPYSGDRQLLQHKPTSSLVMTHEVSITSTDVTVEISHLSFAPDARSEWDFISDTIRRLGASAASEIDEFNGRLAHETARMVRERKAELLRQRDLLASLGVKVRRRDDVPSTYAVPVQRKPLIIKPRASSQPFSPEPALDESIYRDILDIIQQTGVEMERLPGLTKGKDEEQLRDHFIMVLSPHFTSVTGETFNGQGKTDILIRHEGSNVFVAECKFWHGAKACHAALDQLLNYLTWRDSKAALVVFVRDQQLQPVLNAIQCDVPTHHCCIKYQGQPKQGRFMFEFHLPRDPSRSVHVAILCFPVS